jgi:hypothetical protein
VQEPSITLGSSLKYIKGWAFEVDKGLGFRRNPEGRIILYRGSYGEFLSIVREGQVGSETPGFDLIDRQTLLSIRYTRSGDLCGAGRANVPAV